MPALDAHSGMCGPPYEALWHPPGSQSSWELRKYRMRRNLERLPSSLPVMGLQRSSGRQLEQELIIDGQARGRPVAVHRSLCLDNAPGRNCPSSGSGGSRGTTAYTQEVALPLQPLITWFASHPPNFSLPFLSSCYSWHASLQIC